MISFLISIAALILGYFFYGKFVDRIFGPDPARVTPAIAKADGCDYIKMPNWKIFMIQFLNIAGTGPIFGAIMGIKFGSACFLWIVLGSIFGGAMHDYMSGMISIRNDGAGLPEIIGKYLGNGMKKTMLVVCVILLLLVGAVFVYSPAIILGNITGGTDNAVAIWIAVVFAYYIFATFLPIDKLIGKIYPFFAIAMIFMAISLFVCLLIKWPSLPEFWDGFANKGPSLGVMGQSIFPYLFITVACGAISGFHATQSPMMARCMGNEKIGRPIFYGSMITEGIVALIWAAIGSYFFYSNGAEELGSTVSAAAPSIVTAISKGWLGVVGGILALIGVVAAPITTGDTAFRSARLIVSDAFKIQQRTFGGRLTVSLPIFAISGAILWFNISNADGFNFIWRYFGWLNQTLSIFTLFAITVYLAKEKKQRPYYLISLIPACFITSVCITYICVAEIGFNLPNSWIPYIGIFAFLFPGLVFYSWLDAKKRGIEYRNRGWVSTTLTTDDKEKTEQIDE